MGLGISSNPTTIKDSSDGANDTVIYGASSMQGYRTDHEDAYHCCVDYDVGTSIFAVYDGHGGRAVAEYASQKIPEFIKQTEGYKTGDYEKALKEGFLKFDTTLKFDSDMNPMQPEVMEILKEIETLDQMKKDVKEFRYWRRKDLEGELNKLEKGEIENKTKENFKEKHSSNVTGKSEKDEASSISIRKLEITKELKDLEEEELLPFEEVMKKYKWVVDRDWCEKRTFRKKTFFDRNMPGWASGSTAVVALLKDSKIYVANAGDSRCIISKNGEVFEMSIDHKPNNKVESDRITKAGGKVEKINFQYRVDGNLNLSRALGDFMHKKRNDLPLEEQVISSFPDVKVIEIDPDVEFIFLACDGIWNAMRNKEVLDFLRPRLIENAEPTSKICEDLFDHILENCTRYGKVYKHEDTYWRDNKDNMTAVLVRFKNSNLFLSGNKRYDSEGDGDGIKKRIKTDDG